MHPYLLNSYLHDINVVIENNFEALDHQQISIYRLIKNVIQWSFEKLKSTIYGVNH